jgi:hypothetical protein
LSQQNLELIRSIYDAFAASDVPGVLAGMTPDIIWNEAENSLYADRNPYVGPEAIRTGVFARLGAEWDGFDVVPEEYLDAGETVVVLGRYQAAYKATGKAMDAQFAHVWRVRDSKAARVQQYIDTLQAARCAGSVFDGD